MAAVDERWKAVGTAVRLRRGELGMSQEELAAVADVSVPTIRILERARQDSYQANTLAKICRALLWTTDSIQRLYDGGYWMPSQEIFGPIPEAGGPGVETDALSRWHDALHSELEHVISELRLESKRELFRYAIELRAGDMAKAGVEFDPILEAAQTSLRELDDLIDQADAANPAGSADELSQPNDRSAGQ